MTTFSATITKRVRHRRLKDGTMVDQPRWFLNYRDPHTGQRKLPSFTTRREADQAKADLYAAVDQGAYCDPKKVPTVGEAADHWREARIGSVKASTLEGYDQVLHLIKGPILVGTKEERIEYARSEVKPKGARFLLALGQRKVGDLTTAQIRAWYNELKEEVGHYSANRAKTMLKSVLALAEEDYGVRAPSMPTNLERRKGRAKRAILTPEEVRRVIETGRQDAEKGAYYVFPLLTGTRPSEQLGLLWEDVDFEQRLIRIRRILERDCTFAEFTKTEAGTREIPMVQTLREILLNWRVRCPRKDGELWLVFPTIGRKDRWPRPRIGGGDPLNYHNFRERFWKPGLELANVSPVTLYSARHAFISTLQAQGVEVGLVSKLAGHANPNVTLRHYTQAVRGGAEAVERLEAAYLR